MVDPGAEIGSREDCKTIADLAAALRGRPRTARLLIDTPDGLKDLRWVSPTHARAQHQRCQRTAPRNVSSRHLLPPFDVCRLKSWCNYSGAVSIR